MYRWFSNHSERSGWGRFIFRRDRRGVRIHPGLAHPAGDIPPPRWALGITTFPLLVRALDLGTGHLLGSPSTGMYFRPGHAGSFPPALGCSTWAWGFCSGGWRLRFPGNAVVNFCLLGGSWGMVTHLVRRCARDREQAAALQGAAPAAAVIFAIIRVSCCTGASFSLLRCSCSRVGMPYNARGSIFTTDKDR